MTAPSEIIKEAVKGAQVPPAVRLPDSEHREWMMHDLSCAVRAAMGFMTPAEVTAFVKAVMEQPR